MTLTVTQAQEHKLGRLAGILTPGFNFFEPTFKFVLQSGKTVVAWSDIGPLPDEDKWSLGKKSQNPGMVQTSSGLQTHH